MEARLVAMLEPLAGAGNVRATVNVTYAEGTEEHTDEVYDPAQTATLSLQKTEQMSGGARGASGVPGTASNTPAAAAGGCGAGEYDGGCTGNSAVAANGQGRFAGFPSEWRRRDRA